MQVMIFGRQDCDACKAARDKFEVFSRRWEVDDIDIIFYDMETVDGLAESAMHDVGAVPTTLIFDGEDELVRWEGEVPQSRHFRRYLVGD